MPDMNRHQMLRLCHNVKSSLVNMYNNFTNILRERDRQRETETDRDRQREIERDREREQDRQTESETERDQIRGEWEGEASQAKNLEGKVSNEERGKEHGGRPRE